MIREVRFSDEFNRAFKRLKKRYRSLPADLKKLLVSLVSDPEQGTELYNGMRKLRLSIESKGRGKRGGGRLLFVLRQMLQVSHLFISMIKATWAMFLMNF